MSKENNLTDFLTDIANAIRSKKGITDPINPQNFSAEIASIKAGGETPSEGQYLIQFVDYDGTVLKEQRVNKGESATPPTTMPEHEYLTFDEWVGQYENVTHDEIVGALYHSTDGKDRLDIDIPAGEYTRFGIYITSGTVTVDWGDGAVETYDTLSTYIELKHTYVEAFKGTIVIDCDGNFRFYKGNKVYITDYVYSVILGSHSDKIGRYGLRGFLHCNSIVIPSSLTSVDVAGIVNTGVKHITSPCNPSGTSGAAGNYYLTSIVIKQASTIPESYWENNTQLQQITIPSGVKTIGSAFVKYCRKLVRVNNLENSSITELPKEAFSICSSLAEITIPEGVTRIRDSAFYGCNSLVEITIPKDVAIIDGYAFNGCSSLAEITIPKGVTSIGSYAFADCISLTKVHNLENTAITVISSYLFYNCRYIKSITIPKGVTSISAHAFNNCSSLATVSGLGETQLTSIGNSAFYGCSSLTEVNLENTAITSIGTSCFEVCESLKRITLPSTITNIGNFAFKSCTALIYMVVKATTPPTLSSTNAIPSTIGAIYVPDESVEAYKAATNWSNFASKIKGISEMPTE